MRVAAQWIDRALVVSPYYIALCLDEAALAGLLRKMRVGKDRWPKYLPNPSANACVHFFDNPRMAVVCLGSTKGITVEQVHAMLVHEAVHVWQAIRADMGEQEPSAEFEAYSVQSLSQRLMEAWRKGRKR